MQDESLPRSIPTPEIPSGVDVGWWPLIEAVHQTLKTLDPEYVPVQIKEKFGSLRYYFRADNADRETLKAMSAAVQVAERASTSICELCGKKGTIGPGVSSQYWMRCLCSDHRKGQ